VNAAPAKAELPLRLRVGWGLGSLPGSALSVTANVLLMRFMTDTLGISAALGSSVFAFAKLWDAINDPLVGAFSDRVATPWGRRLPWILAGGLLSAVVVVASFSVPIQSGPGLVIYMGVAMLLFATTYSLLMIPYLAMPAEMTQSYHGRTQLMSLRVLFSSIGSSIGLTGGPWLLHQWGATRAGHASMALVIAGVAAAMTVLCVWLIRDAPRTERPAEPPPGLLVQLRSALSNRPFVWLLVAKCLYFVTLAFTLTTFAYFTKHVLKTSDAWLGTFLLAQSLSVVLSQPLWLRVARAFGKQRGFMLAGACYGLAYFSWWFAGPSEPTSLIFARAIAIGVAGGGTFLLTQAMLPDAIEYDHHRTGLRREGVFTGVFVFVEQAAGAVGVAIIGFVLSATGYVATTEGRVIEQPPSAILGIYFCMAILPLVFQVIAIFAISRYDLTAEKLAELRVRAAATT
jgi:glycoside/pentoside/hexuronide:cation symporter, GPH family